MQTKDPIAAAEAIEKEFNALRKIADEASASADGSDHRAARAAGRSHVAAARRCGRHRAGAIRRAMQGQRLGKLAHAVGATSDLKKGRPGGRGGDKLNVAGFVTRRGGSPRTKGALDVYLENASTEIVPRRGRFLWFATPEIPQRVGRRRITPALYRESTRSS